jgi:hypothetical protein
VPRKIKKRRPLVDFFWQRLESPDVPVLFARVPIWLVHAAAAIAVATSGFEQLRSAADVGRRFPAAQNIEYQFFP